MALGNLPVPGLPTIWMIVEQGPTALAVDAVGGCLDIFSLIYPFSPAPPSLWETARYRQKYCLKWAVKPKTTNQQTDMLSYNVFYVQASINLLALGIYPVLFAFFRAF